MIPAVLRWNAKVVYDLVYVEASTSGGYVMYHDHADTVNAMQAQIDQLIEVLTVVNRKALAGNKHPKGHSCDSFRACQSIESITYHTLEKYNQSVEDANAELLRSKLPEVP